MSMNEELQSTNEELETSKEELQSINEELNTVNNQLNEKVGELTDANNDLANLAGATEIATVFLDAKLRIKQFTPRATELLNLIPSDVGRPVSHITQNFDGKSLAAVAAAVMKDLSVIEKEVRIPDGRWYTMRVLPYRTLDNRIDGAVVTFADVSRLKRLEASLQQREGLCREHRWDRSGTLARAGFRAAGCVGQSLFLPDVPGHPEDDGRGIRVQPRRRTMEHSRTAKTAGGDRPGPLRVQGFPGGA